MVWEIWFYDENDTKHSVYIIANDFNEAILKAKIKDDRFNDGMPIF